MKKVYFFFIATFCTISLLRAQVIVNPGICMVTVDDSSKHNIVYYDKTQFGTSDSIICWRENPYTGGYDRVASQPYSAFSMFMDWDTAGDPNIRLHRYKLQAWTPGDGYSPMGFYHAVIYCAQNVANYNWNSYDVQGTGGGMVTQYKLLRDDNSLNAWHVIDSVAGTVNTTTDPNVLSYPNGQWRLVTQWSISCTPSSREADPNSVQTTIIKSKSNITNNKQMGVSSLKAGGVFIYPNPATNEVRLRINFPLAENTSVKIYNSLGVEMLSSILPAGRDEIIVPLNSLAKGIYFAELSNSKTKVAKRLAIE